MCAHLHNLCRAFVVDAVISTNRRSNRTLSRDLVSACAPMRMYVCTQTSREKKKRKHTQTSRIIIEKEKTNTHRMIIAVGSSCTPNTQTEDTANSFSDLICGLLDMKLMNQGRFLDSLQVSEHLFQGNLDSYDWFISGFDYSQSQKRKAYESLNVFMS